MVAAGTACQCCFNKTSICEFRDAPITHWPIIGRPIIGAKQSADYRLIQKSSRNRTKARSSHCVIQH